MNALVKDIMSKSAIMCASTESCQHAAQLMRDNNIGSIPVVKDLKSKHLIGIVTDRDLAMKLIAGTGNISTHVSNVMTSDPVTCSVSDSLASCEDKMRKHQVRRVPVIDTTGRCLGMVSQADIALHEDPQQIQATLAAISKPMTARPTAKAG